MQSFGVDGLVKMNLSTASEQSRDTVLVDDESLRLLVAGTDPGPVEKTFVVTIHADGSGVPVVSEVFSGSDFVPLILAHTPGGNHLLAAGASGTAEPDAVAAALNLDGSLKSEFGDGGMRSLDLFGTSQIVTSALVLTDGSLIVCGTTGSPEGNVGFAAAFTGSGSVNPEFAGNGFALLGDITPTAAALGPQGDIYIAGTDGSNLPTLLALTGDGLPPAPVLRYEDDTGASEFDNITNDTAPAFHIAVSPYWQLYSNESKISGDYRQGTVFQVVNPMQQGVYYMNTKAVDSAGNFSLFSQPLMLTISTKAEFFSIFTKPVSPLSLSTSAK